MTLPLETANEIPVVQLDPWLKPNEGELRYRHQLLVDMENKIIQNEGSLENFAEGYKFFGLNVQKDNSVIYREYAPNAVQASLIGEFNRWEREKNPMTKDKFGVWTVVVGAINGKVAIPHGSKIKITMKVPSGEWIDRLPAWIKRVTQDLTKSVEYDAVFWNPPAYKWNNSVVECPKDPRIYEAHVGIASPEGKVATYDNFTDNVLPRIKQLGYNCIQLMAIMEHAYYASFGYQVTSFFAASSRYGTPEQLKRLVDTAHGLGIAVLLDVVHSHACNNVRDGLNMFDGTDYCYFHAGPNGKHELWNSRLFNYSSYETLRFLLSNIRFWMEEYRFDGFRFDGVTSMLYLHHGNNYGFSGHYDEYFSGRSMVDLEALTYLKLANQLIHRLKPDAFSIAEDVSGMPTLCRPIEEGGVGFDFRLGMAIPDMWIKLLKEEKDEDWSMSHIVHILTNRRYKEKTITYAESHDQALVGDKTLAFWLMDKEMYWFMSENTPRTPIIDRGIALHKMIRLISYGLGGEGYLNFIGNEFGHPEWLDFPREGNGNSFHYARRQFNLVDDKVLRYRWLNDWDAAMHKLESKYHWLCDESCWVSLKNEDDKVVVFERGNLLWIFNFHPTKSFASYRVGTCMSRPHRIVLNSDSPQFGGFGNVDQEKSRFVPDPLGWNGRPYFVEVYIPARSVIVLAQE